MKKKILLLGMPLMLEINGRNQLLIHSGRFNGQIVVVEIGLAMLWSGLWIGIVSSPSTWCIDVAVPANGGALN